MILTMASGPPRFRVAGEHDVGLAQALLELMLYEAVRGTLLRTASHPAHFSRQGPRKSFYPCELHVR